MVRRRVAVVLLLAASLLGHGLVATASAGAQAADDQIPVLQSVTRLSPATAAAPTTLRISYTATDASPEITAWAIVSDPRGSWLIPTATGATGVFEIPLGPNAPAGPYTLLYVGLEDGADPANGATYLSSGAVAPTRSGSMGPTTHDVDFDAVRFELTREGPAPWAITELRPLTLGQPTVVHDISTTGTSVGSSGGAGGTPVRWDVAGAPTNLPVPAGCSGAATAISDEGVILGALTCPTAPTSRQVVWFPNGTSLQLPPGVAAQDVDDLGIVAGSRATGDGQHHAAAVRQDLQVQDLEDSTATGSTGRAMTSYGYVVGEVSGLPGAPQPGSIAVGWFGSSVFPLYDLAVETTAVDVNHLGYALVQIETPGATRGALVGKRSTVLLDDDGLTDEVVDLSYHGVVVGTRATADERFGLFYLGPDTVLRLDSLLLDEDRATWGALPDPVAVNDRSMVVGNRAGTTAWLLQPPLL